MLTVPSALAARRLILESDLIATIGERLARLFAQDPSIATFPPPIEIPPWRMSVVCTQRGRSDKALMWLMARIVDAGREA